jgi:hypothetical protein
MRFATVYAQQAQRFHQVEMSLAGRDDAVARVRRVENLAIDRVGFRECQRCGLLELQPLLDLRAGVVRPADVQSPGRRLELRRNAELRVAGQFDYTVALYIDSALIILALLLLPFIRNREVRSGQGAAP